MATTIPQTAAQKWAYAQQIDAQMKSLLAGERPTHEELDHLLQQLRLACEGVIFTDIEYACTVRVGQRLWDAHISINKRYRKILDRYKKGELKKKVVERRKLEKHYVDFIKTSQFFYKGYIQRLASHFDGMKELRRIANRLSLDTLSIDQRVKVAPDVEHRIKMSCHAALLRLGDLSRYRNDLRTKERSWEPAIGYYLLANSLYPDAGSAHNQLAVIALAENNHLNTVYHMYRSATTKEPYQLAQNNLELEFKKVKSAWDKKTPQQKTDGLGTLVWWFVLLHAKFYDGVDFPGHDELENEVLSRLALLLKRQSFGDTLEKFVIINVAAENFAAQRLAQQGANTTGEVLKAWYFTMAFNIRTMFVLLQVLLPELEDNATGEEIPEVTDGSQTQKAREKISAIARRVLPALRQYSIWLTARAGLIIATKHCTAIAIHAQEMWKMYALVLTRLTHFFPVEDLPSVNYLLEEDESTVGFKPFRELELPEDCMACDLYTDSNDHLKPRFTDPGVERNHPNVEMQARIRDIMICGLGLQLREMVPVTLTNNGTADAMFTFSEEVLPMSSPGQSQPETPIVASPPRRTSFQVRAPNDHDYEVAIEDSTAAADHQSMDTDMHRMVDSLLEPTSSGPNSASDETSYGMHSLTANEVFAPLALGGFENRIQGTPKMLPSLPSLPGLYNSAFTPKPNELQPTSPARLDTSSRHFSPLSLSTQDQRLAAANALDKMTGFSRSTGPWGRSPRPLSNPISQEVNELLQASLTRQFKPPQTQSSMFSNPSSFDSSTPRTENPRRANGLRGSAFPGTIGNNTTTYAGASVFDRKSMLQSSLPPFEDYMHTPPGGQPLR